MDLKRFCKRKIEPRADRLDYSRRALKRAFRQLGRQKLLALRASPELGGKGYSDRDYFEFVETLQSYSGAFGFLQRQHQAAVKLIVDTPQEHLIQRMARGKMLCGVSVSQLRAPTMPVLIAKRGLEGLSLTGKAHWVSGYRIVDRLVVGFFLPEEEKEGLALIPFKKGRTLKISKPIETIALTGMQTVTLDFRDYPLEEEEILKIQPLATYSEATSRFAIHFVNLSGLALSLIRMLDEDSLLIKEYEKCREAFLSREDDSELYTLYATMNRIATELMHLVRYSIGARGVICPNAVERAWRELMLFGVIALNKQVRHACLNALLSIYD